MQMLTVLKLYFCQNNFCYLIFTTVLPTPRETLTGLPEKTIENPILSTTYLRYRPSPPGVTNGAYKLCKRYLYSCEFNVKLISPIALSPISNSGQIGLRRVLSSPPLPPPKKKFRAQKIIPFVLPFTILGNDADLGEDASLRTERKN